MEKFRTKSTSGGRSVFHAPKNLPKSDDIGRNFVPPVRTFPQRPTFVSSTNILSTTNRSTIRRGDDFSDDDDDVDTDADVRVDEFDRRPSARHRDELFVPDVPSRVRPQVSRRKILEFLFEKNPINEPFFSQSPIRVRKNAVFSRTNVVKSLVENEKIRKSVRKKSENRNQEQKQKFIETLRPKIETKFCQMLSSFKSKCSIVIFSMPKGKTVEPRC